jgi:hypothetical protein
MTTRKPLTFGEAAWLLAPALLYMGRFLPIPTVDAELLQAVLDDRTGLADLLFGAMRVVGLAMFAVWCIGVTIIVRGRSLPKVQGA